ncbi:glycerol-3-phosphate O-acyltransferase [Parvibaculum sp. MBR-TMA-1.3b-4.2]
MPAMHHAMRQRPLPPPVERLVNKWGAGGYGVALGAGVTQVQFLDEPPQSAALTAYDREHMKLYMRLLDAATDGADWREAVTILFGLDPAREPDRARHVHDTHLARARWMTEHGYRLLVHEGRPH